MWTVLDAVKMTCSYPPHFHLDVIGYYEVWRWCADALLGCIIYLRKVLSRHWNGLCLLLTVDLLWGNWYSGNTARSVLRRYLVCCWIELLMLQLRYSCWFPLSFDVDTRIIPFIQPIVELFLLLTFLPFLSYYVQFKIINQRNNDFAVTIYSVFRLYVFVPCMKKWIETLNLKTEHFVGLKYVIVSQCTVQKT